jgi:hypothetical protein
MTHLLYDKVHTQTKRSVSKNQQISYHKRAFHLHSNSLLIKRAVKKIPSSHRQTKINIIINSQIAQLFSYCLLSGIFLVTYVYVNKTNYNAAIHKLIIALSGIPQQIRIE